MRRLTVLATVLAAAATAPQAAAASTTITPLLGNTAVSSYGDTQAWSAYDAATKRWHVVVRRGGQLTTPAIPASVRPIEVDVGRRIGGGAQLAYLRCTSSCSVVFSRIDGSLPTTLPGSSGASHPTIYNGDVAWVRGSSTVMTSTIGGANRHVIGGAPKRKCFRAPDAPGRRCQAPTRPRVNALELHGSQLALVDAFELDDGVGANGTVTEVRTESTKGGAQTLVAGIHVGEGDQTFVGPSWAMGRLFFYYMCPGGCEQGGVYRFDPADASYVRAPGSRLVAGFAIAADGTHAYEATTDIPPDSTQDQLCDANGCALRLTDTLAFTPSKSLAGRL